MSGYLHQSGPPCSEIIEKYLAWYSRGFSVESSGEDCVISTPFADTVGDLIDLRATFRNGKLFITDDCNTASKLFLLGVDILRRNYPKKDYVQKLLAAHNVIFEEGELLSPVETMDDLGPALHRLIEVILHMDGLGFASRSLRVKDRDFNSKVKTYLDSKKVTVTMDYAVMGASVEHVFDFYALRADKPRLVKTISTEDKNHAKTLASITAFSFMDLRAGRIVFDGLALVDDSVPDIVTEELMRILDAYSDRVYRWSSDKELFARDMSA